MIRHVVVISWRAEATAEQKQHAHDQLATLPPLMTGLLSFSLGPDAGLSAGNGGFAIVADFQDAGSYLAYRDHPAHVAVVAAAIAPFAEQRKAVQFEV